VVAELFVLWLLIVLLLLFSPCSLDDDGRAMVVVCLVQLIEERGGTLFLFVLCGTKSQ
jgi:hypothetical protein